MTAILRAVHGLGLLNGLLSRAGLWIGGACLGLMLVFILMQVFFRYGLGNALPWSEEASRFLMLWMTGLMVPTAYRHGGFVAVGLIVDWLPRVLARVIALAFLLVTALVLWIGMRIGWSEVTGLGGRFAMSAIQVPTSPDLSTWMKVPRGWMMTSLALGVTLMFLVNLELILRTALGLVGGGERVRAIAPVPVLGAE